jgi:hypothetical protein
MMKRIGFALFLALLPAALGCGKGIEGPPAAPGLADAWLLFEQGRYVEARNAFSNLVAEHGAAAQEGLGWCELRMNNLSSADVAFGESRERQDADAGWAFVKWALEEYSAAIAKADAVLTFSPRYSFSHDTSVNYRDLILHQAFSYFHLADFTNCIEKIKLLDDSFDANPSDPGIETTLLAKLEQLRELV